MGTGSRKLPREPAPDGDWLTLRCLSPPGQAPRHAPFSRCPRRDRHPAMRHPGRTPPLGP
ncbi:hypothetical protein L489_4902, partial [Bordetella bronchiseptica 00-P-2730]